ncbi:hypothetical protein BDF20DRAFT_900963 [Mycotypha africana]|uniref:uncharacterized protein n=1 Tax=Mycotypha africana TaxID=64632 RepID=UPI00230164B2|nr:uncharacterized protein BDF20DRAFT_900963 [Mycotypha africana]KAI8967420.1 hypothetical protein BDF20DRAFT_900963 [Mycotypha africana]
MEYSTVLLCLFFFLCIPWIGFFAHILSNLFTIRVLTKQKKRILLYPEIDSSY